MIDVRLHTTEYRGDHSEEVQIAISMALGEGSTISVEDLADKLLIDKNGEPRYVDWIEIRLRREP